MKPHYKLCLLIDDNFIDNFVTKKILENGGFAEQIIVYQFGKEAINALIEKTITPDVIFLDIRMPEMDGFMFLDEYDKLEFEGKDNVKIYMLSSSLDPGDFKLSTQNKYITQFIHKPITRKTLEAIGL